MQINLAAISKIHLTPFFSRRLYPPAAAGLNGAHKDLSNLLLNFGSYLWEVTLALLICRGYNAGDSLCESGIAVAVIQINVISASGKGAGCGFRMVNIRAFFLFK